MCLRVTTFNPFWLVSIQFSEEAIVWDYKPDQSRQTDRQCYRYFIQERHHRLDLELNVRLRDDILEVIIIVSDEKVEMFAFEELNIK